MLEVMFNSNSFSQATSYKFENYQRYMIPFKEKYLRKKRNKIKFNVQRRCKKTREKIKKTQIYGHK